MTRSTIDGSRFQWVSVVTNPPAGSGSVLATGMDEETGRQWLSILSAEWVRENTKFCSHWMPLPEVPVMHSVIDRDE